MERYTVFMNWNIHYSEDVDSPVLIFRFNTIPIKIPIALLIVIEKLILKFL